MRSRIVAAAALAAGIVAFLPALVLAAPSAQLASNASTRATGVSAPEISAPGAVSAYTDQLVTITATATDPDAEDVLTITAAGAPASLTLSGAPSISPATATLSGTLGAADVGSHSIEWTVASTGGGNATTTTSLTVAANSPPALTAPANVTGAETSLLVFGVTVFDPDGDVINSLTASGLPGTATFTPNGFNTAGQFSWTPPLGSQGTYTVTFSTQSGSPARSASATTTITIGPRDRAPVISGVPGTVNAVTSVEIVLNATVTDPDGDPITSLICRGTQNTPLPPGAVFTPGPNNATGQLRWTPTPAQAGTVSLDFIATSGPLNISTIFVCKIVVRQDRAPVVTAPATVAGSENAAIAFSVTASDPDATPIASLTASPIPAGATFTPNGNNTSGAFAWTPDYTQAGSYSVAFTAANALSGNATTVINVANVDRAPAVTAPSSVSGTEGVALQFTVSASDPDGDAIGSLVAIGGPPTATFSANGSNTTGTFNWTPGFGDAGTYTIQFRATNALMGSATTTISVGDVNRAPTARDGGPYTGVAGVPMTFDGSASSDPDGDALAYSWSFGDGMTGTGVTPSHTYAAGGQYSVVLTVTDNGTPALSDNSTTAANITSVFAVRLFTGGGGNKTIRLSSGKPQWCLQVEPIGFSLSEISIPAIVLTYGSGQIHAIGAKTTFTGDTDNNGVAEIQLCFTKADLRTLLGDLPSGHNTVTLGMSGTLNSGALFSGSITVDVFGTGGSAAASVSPNPLNPEATLTISIGKPGDIRVRLYDASGRFVRALEDKVGAGAGIHDIRIDGRDAAGRRLSTGVYFYKAETPDGVMGGRFTILK